MACTRTIEREFQQGNSTELNIAILDKDTDLAYNLGGVTSAVYEVSKRVGTATPVITKTLGSGVTITTPSTGIVVVTLSDAETASLPVGEVYHQLTITESSGTVAVVLSERVNVLQRR